jgi:hypothetical protein
VCWTFPYLYDVFDGQRRLVYRGQLDGTRPANDLPVTAADVRAAVDAVLAGTPVPANQIPAMGCGIKWKPVTNPATELLIDGC